MAGCQADDAVPDSSDTLIANTWDVNPRDIQLVDSLLKYALQCDVIYIDLLLTDVELADRIESPEHQYCLECKLKALKFCYEHELWWDTVGEMSIADEWEEILSSTSPIALWFNQISLE